MAKVFLSFSQDSITPMLLDYTLIFFPYLPCNLFHSFICPGDEICMF